MIYYKGDNKLKSPLLRQLNEPLPLNYDTHPGPNDIVIYFRDGIPGRVGYSRQGLDPEARLIIINVFEECKGIQVTEHRTVNTVYMELPPNTETDVLFEKLQPWINEYKIQKQCEPIGEFCPV